MSAGFEKFSKREFLTQNFKKGRFCGEKQDQDRRAWSGTARFGRAWRVSVRAGAKRHMPNLHTARPHLQSHSLAAHWRQVGTGDGLCAAESEDPMGIPFSLRHAITSLKVLEPSPRYKLVASKPSASTVGVLQRQ